MLWNYPLKEERWTLCMCEIGREGKRESVRVRERGREREHWNLPLEEGRFFCVHIAQVVLMVSVLKVCSVDKERVNW